MKTFPVALQINNQVILSNSWKGAFLLFCPLFLLVSGNFHSGILLMTFDLTEHLKHS